MEECEYREDIMAKANKVKSKEELLQVIDEIINFKHDYGTIVIGCYAAMKAAFNVIERSPTGGITGFQASCLMWECIRDFRMSDGPARLVNYHNMLYPQYEGSFEKVIDKDTWSWLQVEAKKSHDKVLNGETASAACIQHWLDIINGKVPFGYTVKQ